MIQSKIVIYVIVGLLSLVALSNTFKNLKDTFYPQEKTYSIEAVEMMLKHDRLVEENKELLIDFQIIEKDNERLKKSIPADSIFIANASRAYRDSIRAYTFR